MNNIAEITNCFKSIKDEIESVDLSDDTKADLIHTLNNDIENAFKKITICGKSLKEVVAILNGLDIERQTDIKMTMENLSYLYKKMCEQEQFMLREQFKKMITGDSNE